MPRTHDSMSRESPAYGGGSRVGGVRAHRGFAVQGCDGRVASKKDIYIYSVCFSDFLSVQAGFFFLPGNASGSSSIFHRLCMLVPDSFTTRDPFVIDFIIPPT